MGFGVVEEKEIPEYSTNDAGKILKVDPTGVFLQWLQETVAPAELPNQAGNSGRLLTTNGSTASWTNGPIGLGTTGAATPMLWFGASNNGFAEAWTAGGGATGVSAITNGAVCCTFQSGAIRLPGGNPIRSNGNAASRFQFTQDVPNMQNSVTTGTVGTDRIVNVSSVNWTSTSLDLVCSNTNDTPGALNASSMGIEIKQNQILFNGAGTTASGTTLPARATRMTIDNTQISVSLPLAVSNYITASSIIIATTGFVMNQSGSTTAQAYTFRNFDSSDSNRNNTNRQGIYSPAVGAIAISTNSISAGTTAGSTAGRPDAIERFRVDDNYVTVTNSLNLSRTNPAPSATAPHLLFGDITAPVSGVWGTNDNIFFSTEGVQRMNINNTGAAISNNLTVNQQFIQPFSGFNVTANSQTFDLTPTLSNNVVILMGTFTPVTVRFTTTGFVSGSQFHIVPNSNLSGAVLSFGVTGGATIRLYQGGLTTNHGASVTVSKDTTYHCEFHDNIWYITSHFVSGNASFPGTVTATGFSSSGSASITNNLNVGGQIDAANIQLPAGNEIRFGTNISMTNCVRGGTETLEGATLSTQFVSISTNSSRNVVFRADRCYFDKCIEHQKCPIYEFDTYNTGGTVTLGSLSPPIIFISRPQQHNTTCKIRLPDVTNANMIEGWTVKIMHVDDGGYSTAFAQVEFGSASINLWSDGTQSAFNVNESKNIPIGSVWTCMCHKGKGKWYVTGWSKP